VQQVTRHIRSRLVALGAAATLAALVGLPGATLAQDETAQVRVLHGSGDAPAVDVYADGALIEQGLAYGVITPYLTVPAGSHQIQVVPSGKTITEGPVVIDAPVTFDAGTKTTVAATGSLATGIVPQVIADAPEPRADGTQVRVAHLSYDAPAVDVAVDGGDVVVSDLAYPVASGYLDVPAGSYDLEVRPTGTTTVAFDIDPLTLDAGTSYTAFAVGSLGDGSFKVVPAVDAALAGVRVLHGSADAPEVDVYANGNAILTNVPFGTISDYLYVPAGTYQVQVVPAGKTIEEGPVVIDAPITLADGTLTTVAATNVLAQISPKVIADAPAPVADQAQIRVVHLSADAPKVDIAADGSAKGEAIFKNLKYGKTTKYATVPAGVYDLEVRPAGKKKAAFDIDPVTLETGKSYSAIAIGQLGDGSFKVILAEDASVK
jgi:hypothetical protein